MDMRQATRAKVQRAAKVRSESSRDEQCRPPGLGQQSSVTSVEGYRQAGPSTPPATHPPGPHPRGHLVHVLLKAGRLAGSQQMGERQKETCAFPSNPHTLTTRTHPAPRHLLPTSTPPLHSPPAHLLPLLAPRPSLPSVPPLSPLPPLPPPPHDSTTPVLALFLKTSCCASAAFLVTLQLCGLQASTFALARFGSSGNRFGSGEFCRPEHTFFLPVCVTWR